MAACNGRIVTVQQPARPTNRGYISSKSRIFVSVGPNQPHSQ